MIKRLLSICLITLLVGPAFALAHAQGTIQGEVTDSETGETLTGATVQISELEIGTTVGADGTYLIDEVTPGDYTLVASFVGYGDYETEVTVAEGEEVTVNIELEPDLLGMDELVVIGYGERERRDITGSVASVSSQQIENSPVSTTEQLIQGRTAGVQVTSASGVAGGVVNIRIRGASSIEGGNEPLYVIDGVPMISGETAGAVGQSTNALSDLNPRDIESIEVLKDASATAIYGSRGANGVVLITTKSGQAQGFTEFSADYYRGVTESTFEWPTTTGPEWAEIHREAFDNFSLLTQGELIENYETVLGFPEIPAADEAPHYDYVDEAFRAGSVQEMSLSARGGDETTRYYLSGTYYDTEGYIIENQFERISGRMNLEHEASEIIQIGGNIGVTRTINERPPTDNLVAGTLTSSALMPPVNPIRQEDGTFNFSNPWNIADNAIGVAENNQYNTNHWRTTSNVFAEVRPTSDLSFRVSGGLDLLFVDDYRRYSELTGDGAPDGFGSQNNRETRNWTVTTTANYATTFDDVHRLNTVVGMEFQRHERQQVTASGTGFVSDLFPNVSSAAEASTTTSFVDDTFGMESYFGRATYTFDDRYTFEGSARVDGSSRFGEDNRFGFFPAGAISWRISQEDFFDVSAINDLSLRASYGITGNDQIGDFQSLGLYGGADYANIPGLAPSQLANPELSWERAAQFDIGLDMALFNERLFLNADVYQKTTDDLLLPVQTPLSSGFSSVIENVGEIQNRGVEVSLETTNITGAFEWTTNFNVSYNENEVTELVDGEDIDGGLQRAREGEPLGSWYLIPWEGVDPETGQPQWLDQDGEITNDPTSDDRRIAGQVDPTWFGGIENRFSFRGVTLEAFFQYATGHDVYNATNTFLYDASLWNLHEDMLDRWQEPGDETDIPRVTYADLDGANQSSDRFLEDGSYIRLREATLSYSLPVSLTERFGVSNARVFVQGTNLITWHHMSVGDPEGTTGAATGNLNRGELFFTPPQQRTITGGINLNF